ncbi:hypothetical protein FRB90_001673 [Tulasnella sp. 427]|nr:hypothetical protein FRB90_001673 [Tulasnella sp. 427]
MFDLYPRREPPWDVVEYKEVAQVPMIFDDSGDDDSFDPPQRCVSNLHVQLPLQSPSSKANAVAVVVGQQYGLVSVDVISIIVEFLLVFVLGHE